MPCPCFLLLLLTHLLMFFRRPSLPSVRKSMTCACRQHPNHVEQAPSSTPWFKEVLVCDVSAAEVKVLAAWRARSSQPMSPSLHVFCTRVTRYYRSAKGRGLTLFQVWIHRQNCSSPSGRSTRQSASTLASDTGTAMASCTQLRSGRTRSGSPGTGRRRQQSLD